MLRRLHHQHGLEQLARTRKDRALTQLSSPLPPPPPPLPRSAPYRPPSPRLPTAQRHALLRPRPLGQLTLVRCVPSRTGLSARAPTLTPLLRADASTVHELQFALADRTGIPIPEQRLGYVSRQLVSSRDESLATFGIVEGSTVGLALRLKGGAPKKRCTAMLAATERCSQAAVRIVGDCQLCQAAFCSRHRLAEGASPLPPLLLPLAIADPPASHSQTTTAPSCPTAASRRSSRTRPSSRPRRRRPRSSLGFEPLSLPSRDTPYPLQHVPFLPSLLSHVQHRSSTPSPLLPLPPCCDFPSSSSRPVDQAGIDCPALSSHLV